MSKIFILILLILVYMFLPFQMALAQNQGISEIISKLASDPVASTVFLIQIALGFGLGYLMVKALKYILAIIAILFIGVILNIWQFGNMQDFLETLGIDWSQLLSMANSLLAVLGILTILPIGIGFCIGIVVGAVKK